MKGMPPMRNEVALSACVFVQLNAKRPGGDGIMNAHKQVRLNRRDLFRIAGAGSAATVVPSLTLGAGAARAGGDERSSPVCWEEINHLDREQSEGLWERMAWWHEAKFGMFIHWGPCALASVEISWPIMVPETKWSITQEEYVNLYKRFNPERYDPRAWIDLARAAGQRYMIFTTKHHDGFCMFGSAFTDYKITHTPYMKDIVRMLADACRERSMPLGFYYSPPDMHHPAYRDTSKLAKDNWHGEPTRAEWPLYLAYMEMQVRELLCHYGPAAIIWFDGLDRQEKYDGYRIVHMIREHSPGTLVNNRIGVPGDFETPEQWVPKQIPVRGVRISGTNPEEASALKGGLPEPVEFKPWETCMTINDTWAYNKNDRKFKSTKFLIQTLVDVVSKGGNLLLNVGPTSDGTIQPEFQERLRGIGEWLKANGESIYGTTFGPLQDLPFGRSTAKGGTVYLHAFEWPKDGKLRVSGLEAKVKDARFLAGGPPLSFHQTGGGLTVDVPAEMPDSSATVIRLTTS